jgi:hypothetical protein
MARRVTSGKAESTTNVLRYRDWNDFQRYLQEYFSQSRQRRQQLFFRGQPDSATELLTTLDRVRRFETDAERESFFSSLLDEFRREVIHIGASPGALEQTEALELLSRHHGLPSPLLDWTESPYIAAYFAFEGTREPPEGHVAIWVLDRARLDPEDSRFSFVEDLDLIRFNRRALHQRGVFLRVHTAQRSLPELLGDALTKIVLPVTGRALALDHLDQMTINATYLYADLDGAARTARCRLQS